MTHLYDSFISLLINTEKQEGKYAYAGRIFEAANKISWSAIVMYTKFKRDWFILNQLGSVAET
jgi:hypothetical protein